MINKEEYIKKIELLFDFKIKTKKHLISFLKQDFIKIPVFKQLRDCYELKPIKDIKHFFKDILKKNKELISENFFIDVLAFLYNYEKLDFLENRFIYEQKESKLVKKYYIVKLDEEGFIKVLSEAFDNKEDLLKDKNCL